MAAKAILTGIPPREFIHVLDTNTNITRLETGPQTFHLQANEEIVLGPVPMICIPPGHFCIISNPVKEYISGKMCTLRHGERVIKFYGEPFPLYPGEELLLAPDFGKSLRDYSKAVRPLPQIPFNCALRLQALLDFESSSGEKRLAGDTWQVEGPLTYIPRPEVAIVELIQPQIIRLGEVLRLKAIQDTEDKDGNERVTGEEWLVTRPGAYLPGVWEEVVGVEKKQTLTVNMGLHLRATQTIMDNDGVTRLAGDEWLVTGEQIEEYTPQVGIEVVKAVKKYVVNKGQYAVVVNPVGPKGKNLLGQKVLRKGLCDFFLHPGEELEEGKIQNAPILTEDESLVLQANEEFTDIMCKGIKRKAGERWMICGPLSYIPPIAVTIIKKRKTIPLSKNEGIYVQNTKTGEVRAVMGPCAYMLTAFEELWEKHLRPETELLLCQGGGAGSSEIRKMAYYEQSIDPDILKGRDKTRVVSYRCPGNTAVQVNNFEKKTSRVIFGPDLVILDPEEDFNVLSLSAGKPKRENSLQSMCLMLGPDFITEILEVETLDHARLRLQVSFNNYFEVDKMDKNSAKKIFSVPDFIGFVCRQLSSKIRAAVALTPFDDFHRHSAAIIQTAVFGLDEEGNLNPLLKFHVNNLVISGIDIHSIEPVDTKMRDSLSKSVQQAIEISTNSVEAFAAHEARRREQVAQGEILRQGLKNEIEAEKERTKLYELRAAAAAVESTGQAIAEAQAHAEKTLIECQSEIEAVTLKVEAEEIEHSCKLETQSLMRKTEMEYKRKMQELELKKQKSLANIKVKTFEDMVSTLGTETILTMARAGPQNKVNLLQALGMESMLLTDGSNPINLFTAAYGLVGGEPKA